MPLLNDILNKYNKSTINAYHKIECINIDFIKNHVEIRINVYQDKNSYDINCTPIDNIVIYSQSVDEVYTPSLINKAENYLKKLVKFQNAVIED